MLDKLTIDLDYALENNISTNTILMAFADTAHKHEIEREHISAFMDSMRADLTKSKYETTKDLDHYIYGSANVVGLMCLKVFCSRNKDLYLSLESAAQKLGSAFQKVNFLRDLKEDLNDLGRVYFPELRQQGFNVESKRIIEASIQKDFDDAWVGITKLPGRSKLAVALAYFYYRNLFLKIKKMSPQVVLSKRIRISNFSKQLIVLKVALMYKIKVF